jgi:hypothetical protein
MTTDEHRHNATDIRYAFRHIKRNRKTHRRTRFDNLKYFSKNVAETIDLMNIGELTVLKIVQLQDTRMNPSFTLISIPKQERMLQET